MWSQNRPVQTKDSYSNDYMSRKYEPQAIIAVSLQLCKGNDAEDFLK